MLTTIIAALVKFGPWLFGVAGVVFAAFRHQQASTATAKAAQREAEADAKVAQVEKSEAESNAAASQAGADAAQERTNVEADIAGLDRAAVDERLRRWTRD